MTQETVSTSQTFVMDTAFWTATAIFLLAYAAIISEKIHKTIIAIFGAGLILVFKILQ
jgi:Na+/H+ antiporter NhaD/arsenite permease-like protein